MGNSVPRPPNRIRAAALRHQPPSDRAPRVVLFSGGRGASALVTQLLKEPGLDLTIAINGYDDGRSTGAVRRLLGDSLGPSDFRKNASRLAAALRSCSSRLLEILESRLPPVVSDTEAIDRLRAVIAAEPALAQPLEIVLAEISRRPPFDFSDCAIGNLVFAGIYLLRGRRFNDAVDGYSRLVGLEAQIVNVTSGENAHLVGITSEGQILGSEEEIVDAQDRRRVGEIYLVDRPMTRAEREGCIKHDDQWREFVRSRASHVTLNPRLAQRLAAADLILYAPGTQHSSLYPSYLTPGLADAIARNLSAIKVLITNLQKDAEIEGASAVDIIERALFYMNRKNASALPAPSLFTHFVVNDPAAHDDLGTYVPVGPIHSLEGPHAIRVANYEEGASGRHDAMKILSPFIRTLGERSRRRRLAVVLEAAGSVTKIAQAVIEMVRGGLEAADVAVTVWSSGEPLPPAFLESLPFEVVQCRSGADLSQELARERPDFVLLFDASGMYRGEDVAALARHLATGNFDAVWGSRRLSVREIDESIRFRYSRSPFLGVASRLGSELLSVTCLALYGRYVTDTLSGLRACRFEDLLALDTPLDHPQLNQYLLAQLLKRKADVLEMPVQFLPMSPRMVKRNTIRDGLTALRVLVQQRWVAPGAAAHAPLIRESRAGRSS